MFREHYVWGAFLMRESQWLSAQAASYRLRPECRRRGISAQLKGPNRCPGHASAQAPNLRPRTAGPPTSGSEPQARRVPLQHQLFLGNLFRNATIMSMIRTYSAQGYTNFDYWIAYEALTPENRW